MDGRVDVTAAEAQDGRGGRERTRELAILNAIAEALNRSADTQQALERTLALVAELLGLQTGWIWLLDPETQQFYSAAVQNLPPYLQEPVRMTGRNCWCIDAFQDDDLGPTNIDVLECSRLRPAFREYAARVDVTQQMTRGLRYHASIPLYFQGKPLGIMNLAGPFWRRLTPDELRLLSTIAYQVGIAVERARLAEESTRLARAEERTRLAREIHDTLAQGLTAIALHVEGALTQLVHDPNRARERLERALATARENLEEARRSVLDLRTVSLAGKPLAEALGTLGRAFTSDTGVRVHVRTLPPPAGAPAATIPLRIEAELFRIAQEALANVRKHAQARAVTITLQLPPAEAPPAPASPLPDQPAVAAAHLLSHPDAEQPARHATRRPVVRFVLADDGRGFDPQSFRRRRDGHHGIAGMRERAKLLGGTLRIESRPESGTKVSAVVPLPVETDGLEGA